MPKTESWNREDHGIVKSRNARTPAPGAKNSYENKNYPWSFDRVLALRSKFSPNLSMSKLVGIRKIQGISGNFYLFIFFTRYFLHFLIIDTFIEKLSLTYWVNKEQNQVTTSVL